MQWLEQPAVKWAVPIPMLLLMAPLVWWFFRSTWRQLDADALAVRRELAERGEIDYRPMVALTLTNPATILSFGALFASIGAGTGGPAGAMSVVLGVLTLDAALEVFEHDPGKSPNDHEDEQVRDVERARQQPGECAERQQTAEGEEEILVEAADWQVFRLVISAWRRILGFGAGLAFAK